MELVKRHEHHVAATVISMLGPTPEADDVGQETFLRFYQSLAKFRKEASVKTYLTRIAINLSLNELKRRSRRQKKFFSTPDAAEMDNIPDPRAQEKAQDLKDLVHAGIQKLDPKSRAVIVLRLIDGYSTRETARILRVPVGTVLSRLARAQKKLREILRPVFWNKTRINGR